MADLFQDETDIFAKTASRVAVLIPYPVDKPYDYLVPDDMPVQAGDYVIVPLGAREVVGVVWGEGTHDIPDKKCKHVLAKFDAPPMGHATRDFIAWVARYTLAPLGAVLKMAVSIPAALEPPLTTTLYQRNPKVSDPKGLSPKQQKVWEVLGAELMVQTEIARAAGVSAGVVKTLADKNILTTTERATPPPCRNADPHHAPVSLSEPQQKAADYLIKAIHAKAGVPILLDGVTGAGKTEVYFEAVAECLKEGKQVLILMPEIALSNAFIDRFAKRFGCRPALWHSSLTSAQRRVTWRGVAEGEVQVIVGARSALFLPLPDLGMIIVDESHDASYKQEEGVIYHARDMAIVRGSLTKIPVVLASATPSLETMLNVWEKKYGHAHLPSRHGGATMPDINVIDLRE
ncbi:MAG: primosomal protein N', partial [Pseudobdellovibrionaceae bacterium]